MTNLQRDMKLFKLINLKIILAVKNLAYKFENISRLKLKIYLTKEERSSREYIIQSGDIDSSTANIET